ncbi:MAG: hypothetical protein WBP11_12110 [Dokdonella sp.]
MEFYGEGVHLVDPVSLAAGEQHGFGAFDVELEYRDAFVTRIGMLQYIAPTLQLLIGVWVFSEPFDSNQLIGFAGIWVALAIYAFDGLYHSCRRAPALPAVVAEAATCAEQGATSLER